MNQFNFLRVLLLVPIFAASFCSKIEHTQPSNNIDPNYSNVNFQLFNKIDSVRLFIYNKDMVVDLDSLIENQNKCYSVDSFSMIFDSLFGKHFIENISQISCFGKLYTKILPKTESGASFSRSYMVIYMPYGVKLDFSRNSFSYAFYSELCKIVFTEAFSHELDSLYLHNVKKVNFSRNGIIEPTYALPMNFRK